MMKTHISILVFCICFSIPFSSHGQMKRERVNPGGTVESVFWAPTLIGMSTVEQIAEQNLNVTIMHSFGILTNRTIDNFFGLDIPPNVRLGIDYGITDYWSLGIGRSTREKVVDLRSKLSLLRQKKDDSVPLNISFKGDIGLSTIQNLQPVEDDLNFLLSLPVARKFSDKLSLQVAPMMSHFNTVDVSRGQHNTLYALGLGGEYHVSRRFALGFEYYPVIGKRNPDTRNAFSFSFNIETGGHVFQLFFASAQWHTEQHIIARNRHPFWEGDFRFGFNVNRVFTMVKK